MEQFLRVSMDMPATYRICVLGGMDSKFAERLWGMNSSPLEPLETDQTVLIGDVADQAALIGIVNALYTMGHVVVSVELLAPGPDSDPNEANVTNELTNTEDS